MTFHITRRSGVMESEPSREAFADLLGELTENPADEEHPSVAVTHESEWCLGACADGYLVFENLEEGEPRHMTDVPAAKVLQLWNLLADGDLEAIEREPWKPGY